VISTHPHLFGAYPYKNVVDRLAVEIHRDRRNSSLAAARAAASYLRDVIATHGEARVIFGCAPSQDDFIAALIDPELSGTAVNWSRVVVFHMDDYVGIPATCPQSFRYYLQHHLLAHVQVGQFHPIPAEQRDSPAVCARYAALLRERPIDLICVGIGENGHIAFNDPPVADFDDPVLVKVIEMDRSCRQQQVNDGCFGSIAEVPTHAVTITVPVFREARRLSICVPGARKAAAVRSALRGAITPACPASILRVHPNATLYLDLDSASEL
jgi:glucosamine-6-phosphate deaminase